MHHVALLSADVERTIRFYQDLLEFPLTELFENRDYKGSTHFFFDIGNGNSLAFFDFPGLDLGDYGEVLGGLHHLAISIPPETWHQGVVGLVASRIKDRVRRPVIAFARNADGTLRGSARSVGADVWARRRLTTANRSQSRGASKRRRSRSSASSPTRVGIPISTGRGCCAPWSPTASSPRSAMSSS